jgi:hypothetical protein
MICSCSHDFLSAHISIDMELLYLVMEEDVRRTRS